MLIGAGWVRWCSIIVHVAGLWSCSGERGAPALGRSSANSAVAPQLQQPLDPCLSAQPSIAITADSIGPLHLRRPLSVLRSLCPSSYDTVRMGEERAYPAIAFPLSGVTAIAFQYRDSLRLEEPAEDWAVRGASGVLPGSVAITSSWGEFLRAYGDSLLLESTSDFGVTVMFCALPRLWFKLDAEPAVERGGLSRDASWIPSEARAVEVLVSHDPVAGWQC